MSSGEFNPNRRTLPPAKSRTLPSRAVGWWAIGLSILGLAAWMILPIITAVFGERYPITNTGLMPAIGTTLVVVAAVADVLCLWVWKERSTLNIAASVITIPAAVFFSFMVVGGAVGGTSGIPETTPDVAFAVIEDSSRQGDVVVLTVRADLDGARKIGRPFETEYSAASVRVDSATKIIRGKTVDDVLGARHIDVWFTGPVAESDPVQATAGTIVVSAK